MDIVVDHLPCANTVLDAWDTGVNKTDTVLAFLKFPFY